MMRKVFFICLLVLPQFLLAQKRDTASTVSMFSAAYSYQIPGGDIAKRFGPNSTIGGSFMVKTKRNILLGVEGNFMFGNQLKDKSEAVFDNLRNSNGDIINSAGEESIYILSQRGFYLSGKAGKLIPVSSSNRNSGILINASAGLLQYKIRIDNDGNNTPQIIDGYKKGYDRLTNGLAISEFIGYLHISKNNYANFYAGVEFHQAWTKNRRDINFDTMQKDDALKKDFLYSFKLGWIIPLYKREPDKFYTY